MQCLREIDEVLPKKVKGEIVESTVDPLLHVRINGIDLSTKFTRETGVLLRKKGQRSNLVESAQLIGRFSMHIQPTPPRCLPRYQPEARLKA
jgi:hypothetical protein